MEKSDKTLTLEKFLFHTGYAVIAIMIAAPPAIWMTDTAAPIRFREVAALGPVAPGGNLQISFTFDRPRYCPADIERYIIDGKQIRREITDLSVPPGPYVVNEHQILEVTIPKASEPGPSIYRSVNKYHCNPWQEWVWPLMIQVPDVIFEIKEN